jgi:PAS domain S-box
MDTSNETLVSEEDQSWFQTIFQKIQTGIIIIEAGSHHIVEVNPIAARLIGLPREEIIGKICHSFICPAHAGKCPITDLGQDFDSTERVLIDNTGKKYQF